MAAQSRELPVPYSLPAMHQQRHPLARRSAIGGVVDGQLLARRAGAGEAALGARRQAVADADVGEGAAHHHLVVAAARAVGVEVLRPHAVREQPAARPGCPAGMEPAGEMWSVVTESPSRASTRAPADGRRPARLPGRPREERRAADVGGAGAPSGSACPAATASSLPGLVAVEDVGVLRRGTSPGPGSERDRRLDLLRGGPDVLQVHRLPLRSVPSGSLVRSMSIVPARA